MRKHRHKNRKVEKLRQSLSPIVESYLEDYGDEYCPNIPSKSEIEFDDFIALEQAIYTHSKQSVLDKLIIKKVKKFNVGNDNKI